MEKDKITQKDLDNMKVGRTKDYVLPNWSKARSAQSFANSQKRINGKVFSVHIHPLIAGTEKRSITITRKA